MQYSLKKMYRNIRKHNMTIIINTKTMIKDKTEDDFSEEDSS